MWAGHVNPIRLLDALGPSSGASGYFAIPRGSVVRLRPMLLSNPGVIIILKLRKTDPTGVSGAYWPSQFEVKDRENISINLDPNTAHWVCWASVPDQAMPPAQSWVDVGTYDYIQVDMES